MSDCFAFCCINSQHPNAFGGLANAQKVLTMCSSLSRARCNFVTMLALTSLSLDTHSNLGRVGKCVFWQMSLKLEAMWSLIFVSAFLLVYLMRQDRSLNNEHNHCFVVSLVVCLLCLVDTAWANRRPAVCLFVACLFVVCLSASCLFVVCLSAGCVR